ncbi:MAG TPA: SIS domain-containing protein [Candidatus Acidoferrales bacterium]
MTGRRSAHPYYMHDAILAQPALVRRLLGERRDAVEHAASDAAAKKRIVFVGIGTSLHAAMLGERFLRHHSGGRIHVLVEQSFELVHHPLVLGPEDFVVLISHRGWKNFSVEALKRTRDGGALTLSITGDDGGDGIRTAHHVVTTCEQEVSFAHTKSYTTALAALALFGISVAERHMHATDPAASRRELAAVPDAMQGALACEAQVREIAADVAKRPRLLFIGAGVNWATAWEGALKVKETAYLAAEGFETEQFLHGPISEADERASAVAIFNGGAPDERLHAALRALGEVGVLRVAVVPRGMQGVAAEHVVEVPAVAEWLTPFAQIVPVQFLSYYLALELGANPDTGREEHPAHARAHAAYKL